MSAAAAAAATETSGFILNRQPFDCFLCNTPIPATHVLVQPPEHGNVDTVIGGCPHCDKVFKFRRVRGGAYVGDVEIVRDPRQRDKFRRGLAAFNGDVILPATKTLRAPKPNAHVDQLVAARLP